MNKRAKASKNKIGGPFTYVLNEEMDSKAFLELTGMAVKALLWFKRVDSKLKYKDRDGYTGIFSLTYTEMEKHGFARKTFYNAIKDLTEKGFVEVISTGGLRGAGHTNSKYRLSKRWQLYHLETKPKPLWRFPSEP